MWINQWRIGQVAACLARGGLVAYPTEAVYGLGCDPNNEQALLRLLAAKQRQWQKGLILIAGEPEHLVPFVAYPSELDFPATAQPTTWLVNAHANLSPLIRGGHTKVAVRVSAHPLVKALCHRFGGAITSTSANRAGRAAITEPFAILDQLGDDITMLLRGPLGDACGVSEIRDAETGAVLRQGGSPN